MLKLPTDVLQPGMVLARTIVDERGNLLLRQGIPLSQEYITKLKSRGFSSIYIADSDTDDIVVEDVISEELRHKAQSTLTKVFDFARNMAAEFADADSETLVEALRDPSVGTALRSHAGFHELEDSVATILSEIIETDMLAGISQIRSHDDLTYSHSVNVTVTALMIGKRLYLNRRDLKRLGAGCMLHDIGKIFIPPDSLHIENGQLPSPADVPNLREHPRLGYELLKARNPHAVMTNHVALEHHERQDGRGYPRGMHGTNKIERSSYDRNNILLIAEIASIADVYDILTIDKPDRPGLPPKQIADTMRYLSGSFLNREIVELFLSMLPTLPTGIDIIVRTGRFVGFKGIVAQANLREPDRPRIRLLKNAKGDRITPIELDLNKEKTVTVEAMLHQ
jgi:HD-GYP domain-containing protein (c-di-GMP phosphodiesterase class II)